MFGIPKMFGGGDKEPVKASVPEHYSDADRPKTGVEATGVTQDTATVQETQRAPEQRYTDIKAGIEAIMFTDNGPGFSVQDMLGRQDFFAEKLVENKVLSPQDIGFEGIMEDIVKAAREVSLEGINNVGRAKNWKQSA